MPARVSMYVCCFLTVIITGVAYFFCPTSPSRTQPERCGTWEQISKDLARRVAAERTGRGDGCCGVGVVESGSGSWCEGVVPWRRWRSVVVGPGEGMWSAVRQRGLLKENAGGHVGLRQVAELA